MEVAAKMLVSEPESLSGQQLSHYQVLEGLGSGGMGVVYRAHDEHLDRGIALKVLADDALTNGSSGPRFVKQARALSRLSHPHICIIHEAGEADGHTYIAMESVEGRTLTMLLRGEGLPVDTAARYAAQITDALAHAHERGSLRVTLPAAPVP